MAPPLVAALAPSTASAAELTQHAVAVPGADPSRTIDAGLNHALDGHNARAGLAVQTTNPPIGSSYTGVQLGIQIRE